MKEEKQTAIISEEKGYKGGTKLKGSTSKRYPQTPEEMHMGNLARSQTRVYKHKGTRSERVTDLIARGMDALADVDVIGKIPLSDTERLKEQTFVYLEQCRQDGILPDNQSYALALGHTTSSISYYLRTKPENDPSREFLERTRELFSALLSQAALGNDVNNIFAIFSQKANFGWREDKHVVVETINPLGEVKTEAELKQINDKYAIDAEFEEVEE